MEIENKLCNNSLHNKRLNSYMTNDDYTHYVIIIVTTELKDSRKVIFPVNKLYLRQSLPLCAFESRFIIIKAT